MNVTKPLTEAFIQNRLKRDHWGWNDFMSYFGFDNVTDFSIALNRIFTTKNRYNKIVRKLNKNSKQHVRQKTASTVAKQQLSPCFDFKITITSAPSAKVNEEIAAATNYYYSLIDAMHTSDKKLSEIRACFAQLMELLNTFKEQIIALQNDCALRSKIRSQLIQQLKTVEDQIIALQNTWNIEIALRSEISEQLTAQETKISNLKKLTKLDYLYIYVSRFDITFEGNTNGLPNTLNSNDELDSIFSALLQDVNCTAISISEISQLAYLKWILGRISERPIEILFDNPLMETVWIN